MLFSPTSGQSSTWQGVADVGARFALLSSLSVGIDAKLPLSEAQVNAGAATASVRVRWFGVDVAREQLLALGHLHLSYGAGVALIDTRAVGVATAGFVSHSLHTLSPTPYVAGSLGVFVLPTLRLGVELSAGYSVAPLKFSVDGDRLGQVGPFVSTGVARLEILLR
jgi:hypothetical protein